MKKTSGVVLGTSSRKPFGLLRKVTTEADKKAGFCLRRKGNKRNVSFRLSSKPAHSLIRNFRKIKFEEEKFDISDSLNACELSNGRISFKGKNPLNSFGTGPSKKGMFDDMTKVNLQTTRKLKKKIDMFIEPYNKVHNSHFFMRFGDDPYPRLPQCLFPEGIKVWRKISNFILKENNSSFNRKMNKMNNEEFDDMMRRIRKSREMIRRKRRITKRGTIKNANFFLKMKYSNGGMKRFRGLRFKGGSPSSKASEFSPNENDERDSEFFKSVSSEKLNSSMMTQNDSDYIPEVSSESEEFSFENSDQMIASPPQRKKAKSFKKIRRRNSIKIAKQTAARPKSRCVDKKKAKVYKEKSKLLSSFNKPRVEEFPRGESPWKRPSRFTENSKKGSKKSMSSLGIHADEGSLNCNMKEIFLNFKTQEIITEKSVKLNFNFFHNSVIKEESHRPKVPKKLSRKQIINYFYKGRSIVSRNLKMLSSKATSTKRIQNSRLFTDKPRLFDSIKKYSNDPHQVSRSQKEISCNPIGNFKETPVNDTIMTSRIPIRPFRGILANQTMVPPTNILNSKKKKHESRLKFNKRLTKFVKRKIRTSQNRRRSMI
ncbi:unnamed protein product [Moneuplotes crassus]|uniref:Uncharacterized protein n=1 Tax=Euplotes crassus TaxID=5936 RepID=A0AAD1Y5R1_EUPCR|nr:unnamed protein product [Moneuplotes crassus]